MHIFLFDIDGTLINTGGAGGAALLEAFSTEFGVAQPGQVPFSGRTDRGIGSNLFALHGIDDTEDNWQRLRTGYIRQLPVHLPQRQGRVLPGVAYLLDQLAGSPNVSVGLLTGNMRDGARLKLEHYQLFHHFAFGGFGDEHRDRDAVAQAALLAAGQQHNGSSVAERTWVIGDTPLDIRCARAIGARAIAVATGIHPKDELVAARPDFLLDDLSDTDQVLRLLGSCSETS